MEQRGNIKMAESMLYMTELQALTGPGSMYEKSHIPGRQVVSLNSIHFTFARCKFTFARCKFTFARCIEGLE